MWWQWYWVRYPKKTLQDDPRRPSIGMQKIGILIKSIVNLVCVYACERRRERKKMYAQMHKYTVYNTYQLLNKLTEIKNLFFPEKKQK